MLDKHIFSAPPVELGTNTINLYRVLQIDVEVVAATSVGARDGQASGAKARLCAKAYACACVWRSHEWSTSDATHTLGRATIISWSSLMCKVKVLADF